MAVGRGRVGGEKKPGFPTVKIDVWGTLCKPHFPPKHIHGHIEDRSRYPAYVCVCVWGGVDIREKWSKSSPNQEKIMVPDVCVCVWGGDFCEKWSKASPSQEYPAPGNSRGDMALRVEK